MKKAFTLVELIVVIGIICILAGVLFATLGGGTESAKTARCLSNMRNLATACQAYGAETRRYPHAGSIEYMKIDNGNSRNRRNVSAVYFENPGWISWASMAAYQGKSTSHRASASWMTSMYNTNLEENRYCLTNGCLWKYVSGNHATYVCPGHAAKFKDTPPQWSYLMNAYFGWDSSRGSRTESENYNSVEYGRLPRADRVLLFCEVPWSGKVGSWQPTGSGSGTECDCILQYDTSVSTKSGGNGANLGSGASGNENIGFNHKSGKETFANVVFADAHVEKLRLPKKGLSDGDLRNLTSWLCTGTDVSFDGKRYDKMDN